MRDADVATLAGEYGKEMDRRLTGRGIDPGGPEGGKHFGALICAGVVGLLEGFPVTDDRVKAINVIVDQAVEVARLAADELDEEELRGMS